MISHQTEQYAILALYSLGGFVLGYLFEKLILTRIERYALKTKWKFDDVIFTALKGLLPIWGLLLSHSISANITDFNEHFQSLSNKISMSVLILTFAIFVTRILISLIQVQTLDESGVAASSSIILNIIKVIVFLIGAMLILQVFGVSVAPLLTALGVGGLAVALALQETLSNLFAGIQIIASKRFRNGDYIKLSSGEEGFIMDITWRNTVIRAMQDNMVIIPNSKLSSAIIVNYNFPELELSVPVDVGVSYESDLEQVEKITLEVAKTILSSVDGGVKDFEPAIRYHTFGDSSINFRVILRASEFEKQFALKHEFIKALHKKYKEKNIEIPFPIRTVIMKK